MHWIDWLVVVLPIAACTCIAVYTRRFVRSVADFMAGGRNAGRFLICTAKSEQGVGPVSFVGTFQKIAVAGFTLSWWDKLLVPVTLLTAITGFIVYRYRQTRALTLAQFFEMRYSRRFRLFTGGLAFFAGLVNFGIIPVIGARFMVFFLELPQTVHLFSYTIPTYLLLMGLFLTLCTLTTTLGGQVTVLLTDCAEGMISQVFYVIIVIAAFCTFFDWGAIQHMLLDTRPGHSLVNPFDTSEHKDFNVWFILMTICVTVYSTMAWQNSHAFNSSATSPHESRMGGILGKWRGFAANVMIMILAICALAYLKTHTASVDAAMAHIADPSIRSQMPIPIALSQLLPVGIKGALVAICLMGIISGDGIALHSWGSILVQDVIMPLRKTPLTTSQHLLLLRLAITGVAIWGFLFGALFPQTEYVIFWFSVTMAIFTGGAGAAIIGGLYWSRGTTAGAWTGLLLGSSLSVGGITARVYFQQVLHREFPLNGMQISFFASLIAIAGYAVVSLLTCRVPHNMNKLLHRGQYAIAADAAPRSARPAARAGLLSRIVGINDQFTRYDRWITWGIFWWSMTWVLVFAIGSLLYMIHPWSDRAWSNYWLVVAIVLPTGIGIATTVWFTIGCWHDMRNFFRRLREEHVDEHDDGRVEPSSHAKTLADDEACCAAAGTQRH